MKDQLIKRYQYHNWANERVLNHIESLPGEVYSGQVKSVFSSVADIIAHMYQVDGLWLSVMEGDAFDKTFKIIEELKQEVEEKELNEMRELYANMAESYLSFLNAIKSPDQPVTAEHPRYGKLSTTIRELIGHVVNHGTYHRGNISAMLHQHGQKGVPTDYVLFLYEYQNGSPQDK